MREHANILKNGLRSNFNEKRYLVEPNLGFLR